LDAVGEESLSIRGRRIGWRIGQILRRPPIGLAVAPLPLLDAACIALSLWGAYSLRFQVLPYYNPVFPDFYLRLAILAIPAWLVIFALYGLYHPENLFGGLQEYASSVNACTVGLVGIILYGFLDRTGPEEISRGWLALVWGLSVITIVTTRFVYRRLIYRLRQRGLFTRRVLIVGTNEINKLGMPVGKQDQYAAAFGGLNCFTFLRDEVRVEPLRMPPQARQELERGLMLFFTGISRQSSTILKRQQEASKQGDQETIRRLTAIKELGQEIRCALETGDLWTFGELLHRSWLEKRQVTEGITNPELDRCYEVAREAGALGGKVTGAGGGGFLMLFCPPARQADVTEALTALGLQQRPFAFEDKGVQILQGIPWTRSSPRYPFGVISQSVNAGAEVNSTTNNIVRIHAVLHPSLWKEGVWGRRRSRRPQTP